MLTTSGSTESTTRPGKGKVGVGGNGSDDGGHIDGGGGSGDKSVEMLSKVEESSSDAPKSMCLPVRRTSMLRTSSSTAHQLARSRFLVEFDGVNAGDGAVGKLVKKLSKSQRIVKKSKKP